MSSALINWAALTPALIVFGAAVLAVLVEALLPRGARRPAQVVLSIAALLGSVVAIVWRWGVMNEVGPSSFSLSQGEGTPFAAFVEDPLSLGAALVILVSSVLALLVIADRTVTKEGAFAASAATTPGSGEERESTKAGFEQTEVFPLTLFAVGGMLAFVMSNDLLTLFIALEALSLPLYVLTATARRRRALSQEAALKYFLLGAFSSAFFLMGAALLYGFSGTISYSGIYQASLNSTGMDYLFYAGIVLVLIGLLFKVGAVPFHSWTPDTYQGAPTPITGFMAAGTKVAAFAAMLRFMYEVGAGAQWNLQVAGWVIIIATMLVGTVGGIVQNDVKRMLAYSSIAHAGFILIAVFAFDVASLKAVVFYLLAYGLATVGAFGIVTLVRAKDANGNVLGEATDLDSWKGLGKTHPFLAFAMMIFLLSFAGIPLTAGFVGKFLAFSQGVASGQEFLVVLAVLASAATGFFYFRLAGYMFLAEPNERTTVVDSEGYTLVAVTLALIATIILGVYPQPVLDFLSTHMIGIML